MFQTGYYGEPGSAKGNFTVHVVRDWQPICGWRPRRELEFQFCANGVRYEMIECEGCKKKAGAILASARAA